MILKLSRQRNIDLWHGTSTRPVKVLLYTTGNEALAAADRQQNVSQETDYVLPASVNGTTRVCRTVDSEETRPFDSRRHVVAMG